MSGLTELGGLFGFIVYHTDISILNLVNSNQT